MKFNSAAKISFALVLWVSLAAFGRPNNIKSLKGALKHYQRACALDAAHRLDRAIAEYRQALRRDPDEAYWHAALAADLEKKGDLQTALDEYRLAAQLSPGDDGLRLVSEKLTEKYDKGGTTVNNPFNGGGIGTPYPGRDGDSIPVRAYGPEPPYSDKARALRYSGQTLLWIVVDAQGNVGAVQVSKPANFGLDQNAIETVRDWKFKPGTVGGAAVPVKLLVEVNFKLR